MRRKGKKASPVREALLSISPLQDEVFDGLDALKREHRKLIDGQLQPGFADSLDLDEALRLDYPADHRWDYLLGHTPSESVVALEPHWASEQEIETLIAKREAARRQLKEHLTPGAHISAWLWVASGKVRISDTEKTRRRLDQHGIQFVGGRVQRKHLPPAVEPMD